MLFKYFYYILCNLHTNKHPFCPFFPCSTQSTIPTTMHPFQGRLNHHQQNKEQHQQQQHTTPSSNRKHLPLMPGSGKQEKQHQPQRPCSCSGQQHIAARTLVLIGTSNPPNGTTRQSSAESVTCRRKLHFHRTAVKHSAAGTLVK